MGGETGDMASTVGMMGALRTGNPIIDVIIAMAVPLVFKMIMDAASNPSTTFSNWRNVLIFWSPYYTRDIEHKMVQTSWGGTFSQDRNLRNNVLIKAVQLYLEHKQIEYNSASMQLISTKQESDRFWEDDSDGENTAAGKLKRFKVARKPPRSRWTVVTGKEDKRLVELMVDEREEDKGEKAEKTQVVNTYRFRSVHKGAIDDFVDTCYAWYIAELKKQEDNSRYLYEMQIPAGSSKLDDDSSSGRHFKRYKLSDEKQFGSLFFDEKPKLLALLRHFLDKTGKYSVQGFPHKLGLLLHGPPGTGKTSLIKALAQYTGRSIVNVPLARISTNSELMDIMFDQQFPVAGDDVPVKLGFKDVIFVMEDVDAASKVVQRRDGRTGRGALRHEGKGALALTPEEKELRFESDADAVPFLLLLGSEDSGVKELVDELMKRSERLREFAIAPENVRAAAARLKMPKPPGPTSEKERAEYEKLSPAERVERARQKAQEVLGAFCERKERTESFVSAHAAMLRRLLKAGGVVDAALEDELLGIAPAADGDKATKAVAALAGGYSGATTAVDDDEDEDDEMESAQMMQAMMMSMMSSGGGGASSSDAGISSVPVGPGSMGAYGGLSSTFGKKDKLNLSGLLNVLDGVVDTPERIVIMTTNHPEVLDPALIRPGRIDQKLLLSHMKPHNVTAMIEHYFRLGGEGLDRALSERVYKAILGDEAKGVPGLQLTPAQVEQLSAEHDEVEEMVAAIEAMVVGGGGANAAMAEEAAKPPCVQRQASKRVAG